MAKPFASSPTSRTAGRFVAANYGQWSLNVFSFPAGTGTKQFAVTSPLATLTDGRQIIPFNTNAPIYVGSEKVTPTAVVQSSANPGGYLITASFSSAHGAGETVSSATFGLQEALNDANASGGGIVVIDSAWAALGGTTTIKNAATIPSGTAIEDVRSGTPSGTGTVTSVSVTTANGVSGTVATATTTPAISLTLGAITPTSVVPTTPIAIANGGTGAATLAAAQSALAIGLINIGNLVTVSGATLSGSAPWVFSASAASDVTFSVIPGTFLKLHIDWQGSASTLGSVSLQFNDDVTSGNYADQIGRANNATASAIANVTQTSMQLVAAFSSSGVGMAHIEIPMYSQTINKLAYGAGGIIASASSGTNNFNQSGLGFWNSTAAITKIKIFNDQGGTFTGIFTISASR